MLATKKYVGDIFLHVGDIPIGHKHKNMPEFKTSLQLDSEFQTLKSRVQWIEFMVIFIWTWRIPKLDCPKVIGALDTSRNIHPVDSIIETKYL